MHARFHLTASARSGKIGGMGYAVKDAIYGPDSGRQPGELRATYALLALRAGYTDAGEVGAYVTGATGIKCGAEEAVAALRDLAAAGKAMRRGDEWHITPRGLR